MRTLVADGQLRERGGRPDRVQQMQARVGRVRQRVQAVVEFAVGDGVEQEPLGICGRRACG